MIAIGSKFVGPNSFRNETTKESWSVLPALTRQEAIIQAGLLRQPPPPAPARSRVVPGGGGQLAKRLGGAKLGPESNAVPANLGLGGLSGPAMNDLGTAMKPYANTANGYPWRVS